MVYRPFGFSTRASGMFGRTTLGMASLGLHWGLLLIFIGHVSGLISGLIGFGPGIGLFYWSGLIGGFLALGGSAVALIRRMVNPEVKAMSQPDDYIVHYFLIAIIGIALYQVIFDQIFGVAYPASAWFASILQFSPQPALMGSASFLSKLHVFLALTFFAYFPFTKLAHFWTYPINYIGRSYQSMRTQAKQYQKEWDFSFRSDNSWMVFAMVILIGGFMASSFLLGDANGDGTDTAHFKSAGLAQSSSPRDELTGYPLYVSQCARCHGLEGKGNGPGADSPKFARPPRDLTAGNYRFVSTKNKVASDADLRKTLREGLAESGMPGFPELSDRQIESLVAVLDGLWKDRPEAGKTLDVPEPPKFSDSLRQKGKKLYNSKCARCHGKDGHPEVPNAQDFADGVVKRGTQPKELYRRIALGIPGTQMLRPVYGANLSDRQIWSIVAYLRSRFFQSDSLRAAR
jgi:nitrate reductase gamma subunit